MQPEEDKITKRNYILHTKVKVIAVESYYTSENKNYR